MKTTRTTSKRTTIINKFVHFSTLSRCGTHIIRGSLETHYRKLGYVVLNDTLPFKTHSNIQVINTEQYLLPYIDSSRDIFYSSHPFLDDANFEKIVLSKFDVTTIFASRRDTFDWFLAVMFNATFVKSLGGPANVFSDEQATEFKEKLEQVVIQQEISWTWILNQIEQYMIYYNKRIAKPDSIELFYEDMVADPEAELAKLGIEFIKTTSSIKWKKPSYDTVYSNLAQAKELWFKFLDKRLKLCGTVESRPT